MANKEQLKILTQGVKVWNQWRKEHPEVKIDLHKASLSEANLSKANLSKANLSKANLDKADLEKANLKRANLIQATLSGADLRNATLNEADLIQANLSKAYLFNANLYGVDLVGSRLIQTDLTNATITGACLYGTSRDDWVIDGILCDFVYWDEKFYYWIIEKQKQWKQDHRVPKDRDFRPGEFEELYKSLPTFIYYFEQGFTPLDPLIMDRVVQAINEQHPKIELKLDSFHSRGQAHAVFTVLPKESIEEAKQQVASYYERRLAALEGQQQQLLELFSKLSTNPQPQLISGCEQVIIDSNILGDNIQKTARRDYLEHVENSDVTTGNSQEKSE